MGQERLNTDVIDSFAAAKARKVVLRIVTD